MLRKRPEFWPIVEEAGVECSGSPETISSIAEFMRPSVLRSAARFVCSSGKPMEVMMRSCPTKTSSDGVGDDMVWMKLETRQRETLEIKKGPVPQTDEAGIGVYAGNGSGKNS